MSSDLNTTIKMNGTHEELLAMLSVLKKFEVDNYKQYCSQRDCAYLDFVNIIVGKKEYVLAEMSDEELIKVVSSVKKGIVVEALGPWGVFEKPKDVGLFEALASVSCNASFEGEIDGYMSGAEVNYKVELKDGKLYISDLYLVDDVFDELYIKDFKSKLSFDGFCELFSLDNKCVSDNVYIQFIYEAILEEKVSKIGYKDFFEDHDLAKITKEQWLTGVNRLKELGVVDYKVFIKSVDVDGFVKKSVVDVNEC